MLAIHVHQRKSVDESSSETQASREASRRHRRLLNSLADAVEATAAEQLHSKADIASDVRGGSLVNVLESGAEGQVAIAVRFRLEVDHVGAIGNVGSVVGVKETSSGRR